MNQNQSQKPAAPKGSFKSLIVWQRAIDLTLAVYRLTAQFPASEQFGLTSQLRRASVSVASNIAEGYGRSTRGEYILFLGHARGSYYELLTQLTIADGLKFGTDSVRHEVEKIANEVGKMLVVLMNKLQQ